MRLMRTLNEAQIGETVKVLRLNGEGILRRRIMEMGITKGCDVKLLNIAPLGDPIEVEIRGYSLTIRKKDAEIIEITDAEEVSK
jgi:Fe2+ transport system protein A